MGTIDCWLIAALTGGAAHATDPTNASRTLLYDLRRRSWDADLLELMGVPAAALPEIRPSSGALGVTSGDRLGVEAPIAGVESVCARSELNAEALTSSARSSAAASGGAGCSSTGAGGGAGDGAGVRTSEAHAVNASSDAAPSARSAAAYPAGRDVRDTPTTMGAAT